MANNRLNEFEMLKRIGGGSRGPVIVARNIYDKKEYAIRKATLKPELNERLLRELRIIANLDHHNIVAYKNSWKCLGSNNEEHICIQMQLCHSDLRTWFRQNHPATRVRCEQLDILYQLTSGVEHIHNNNYMHRNLTPENIFFLGKTVKVGNFHMAKYTDIKKHTKLDGEPRYKSPELLEGRTDYTTMVDIFALGIIFFEMLNPVKLVNAFEIGQATENAKNHKFPNFRKDMNAERHLISWMLETDPDSRPTASQILQYHVLFQKRD